MLGSDDAPSYPLTIEACVRAHPGIHLRALARRCQMTLGTASHYLNLMEDSGALDAALDGRYKRYFWKGQIEPSVQKMLIACRRRRAHDIIHLLVSTPEATQRTMAAACGITRSAVAPVVRSLVDRGILTTSRGHGEQRYGLADPELASRVLRQYQDTLASPDSDGLEPRRAVPVSRPMIEVDRAGIEIDRASATHE